MSKEKVTLEEETTSVEAPKEFAVSINISDKNLSYKSDFNEAETIFWLEAVKNLIIQKTFEAAGMKDNS
jgi:hypothetical protein